MHDVDGVNAGYARLLLDEYLDNPESVSPEWRALFESGDAAGELVRSLPGLARLLERGGNGQGNGRPAAAVAPRSRPPAPPPRRPARPAHPAPRGAASRARRYLRAPRAEGSATVLQNT